MRVLTRTLLSRRRTIVALLLFLGIQGCAFAAHENQKIWPIREIYSSLSERLGQHVRVRGEVYFTSHATYLSSKECSPDCMLTIEQEASDNFTSLDQIMKEATTARTRYKGQDVIVTGILRQCRNFENICLVVEEAKQVE